MDTLTTALITLAGAVAGGLAVAVFNWWAGRPKSRLDLSLSEAGGVDSLVSKIKDAMNQSVKDAATIATQDLNLKIKEARLAEYRTREAEILRDHGAAEERERQCLYRIEELADELHAQRSQIDRNKQLTDQVAQLSAILDTLRREGIWKPETPDQTKLLPPLKDMTS